MLQYLARRPTWFGVMATCTCVLGTSLAECDGQTDRGRDRRICHHNIVFCMHNILTRDKKSLCVLFMLAVTGNHSGVLRRCWRFVSYRVTDWQDDVDFRLAIELCSNITRLLTVIVLVVTVIIIIYHFNKNVNSYNVMYKAMLFDCCVTECYFFDRLRSESFSSHFCYTHALSLTIKFKCILKFISEARCKTLLALFINAFFSVHCLNCFTCYVMFGGVSNNSKTTKWTWKLILVCTLFNQQEGQVQGHWS